MTLNEAIQILGILGSDQDPIVVSGLEVTPLALEGTEFDGPHAEKLEIQFYGDGQKVTGTLLDMVLERLDVLEVRKNKLRVMASVASKALTEA